MNNEIKKMNWKEFLSQWDVNWDLEASYTADFRTALWERGGERDYTGEATIICDENGNPKVPFYVRKEGYLKCGKHALIKVAINDVVIIATHQWGNFIIKVNKIVLFAVENEHHTYIHLETLATFKDGKWDNEEVAEKYKDAIKAAVGKAKCYNCKAPHYVAGTDICRTVEILRIIEERQLSDKKEVKNEE